MGECAVEWWGRLAYNAGVRRIGRGVEGIGVGAMRQFGKRSKEERNDYYL